MILLQSIASVKDAQQTESSSQSWGEFFAKWFGWPLVPDTWTSAETGPFQIERTPNAGPGQRVRGKVHAVRLTLLDEFTKVRISTLGNNIETSQQQNPYEEGRSLTLEVCRTMQELHDAKDTNGRLQMEKARLEQKIEALQALEIENYRLKMTNYDLESRITRILDELQKVQDRNERLQASNNRQRLHWQASAFPSEMTEIDQRNLYQIRRRIIVEKTAKALGRRYHLSKGRRESFDHWSRRVKYPGWERISKIAMRVMKQGNKSAHQATRMELEAAMIFGRGDGNGEEYPEEAEVLQEMLDIIYDGGEIDEDEDDTELEWS